MNINIPQFGSHFRSRLTPSERSDRWKQQQTRSAIAMAALLLSEVQEQGTPKLHTLKHPQSGKTLDIVSIPDRFYAIATDQGFDALCLDRDDTFIKQELKQATKPPSRLFRMPHGSVPNREAFRQAKKALQATLQQS